jgi:8-oxo-dGTP pyrophosphatase MutT (NUDIX family)
MNLPSHSWDVLARLPMEAPPEMVALAEARRVGGPAATPALSASVILVRDGAAGIETYLLHRHARMPFAASMVVFPGGRVDPVDQTVGSDPLRECAVRETAEETGVQLSEDDLVPWAHWITPEPEPRRYDTHFFLAVMPEDQAAQDISGETDRAAWDSPSAALAAADRGEIALMPPTRSILLELAEAHGVAELLAVGSDRVIEYVLPEVIKTESGWMIRYPSRLQEGLGDRHG